jgi:3-methyladenine DNA glycosylase AlkD
MQSQPVQMTTKDIHLALTGLGNPDIADHSRRFFKTGHGEYGEGDQFLGIRVPVLRKKAKEFNNTPLNEILCLLRSIFHEERLMALFMLVEKYDKGSTKDRREIYRLYMKNIDNINNWDLVDSSAGHIVGAYLADKNKQPIYHMARSKNIWEKRIAIISTFPMIKAHHFRTTLEVSRLLLKDNEDLIHKAVGWMLREVGKRDMAVEKKFLKKYYKLMPRTMLRYAIEKFPDHERKKYLKGLI